MIAASVGMVAMAALFVVFGFFAMGDAKGGCGGACGTCTSECEMDYEGDVK